VAVVGFNGRGKDHIKEWSKLAGVRLTALCDVDKKVLEAEADRLATVGTKVEAYQDIRQLLQSKNVDAISIATPNHWHALASIWGMQAGKDIYVEKPVSYDVWEGEKMIEAAHRYKKIVQAGTQSRSSLGIKEAVAWVQKGNLGKIRVARALCYKPRPSIGKTVGPQAVPATVDYNLWCGPASLTPPRPLSLRLALVLELWRGRPRQPGHTRNGCGPLVPGGKCLVASGPFRRRAARLRG
jgi:hypothetical protein